MTSRDHRLPTKFKMIEDYKIPTDSLGKDVISTRVLSRYTTKEEPEAGPAPNLLDHHHMGCRFRLRVRRWNTGCASRSGGRSWCSSDC